MSSHPCISLSTCALLALNLTAGFLGLSDDGNGSVVSSEGVFTEAGQSCPSLERFGKEFSAKNRQLLFGNPAGLRMQPEEPEGRILVFGARGGDDKSPGQEHRGDTIPICNAIIELGWSCIPVFYSDSARNLILKMGKTADGYVSRVNPDVYEDFTLSKFEGMLEALHERGLAAMAHPRMIGKFGAKDALAKVSALSTGLPDTLAYYTPQAWTEGIPTTLSQGPRVIKQNRGSQGEGVWIARLVDERLYRVNDTLPLDTKLELMEAVDNHKEYMTLGEFITFAMKYLEGGEQEGAQIIDQAFMPRIVEGEVRVLFVGSTPVEIVHKKPKPGGLSATLKAGATYTKYAPDAPEFKRLMSAFVKRDLEQLLPVLGLEEHPLPLLWTADFILGGPRPPWVDGKDYYFIGELNCACVGMTTQLHLAPRVAA
ncbi:hypothetical protein T484DRAFT_1986194, partial [Baffinella frigidus]